MTNAGQESPWVVYDYEVNMLNEMRGACTTGARETFPHPIRNAIVESMLLHLRILVELLCSSGSDPDVMTSNSQTYYRTSNRD